MWKWRNMNTVDNAEVGDVIIYLAGLKLRVVGTALENMKRGKIFCTVRDVLVKVNSLRIMFYIYVGTVYCLIMTWKLVSLKSFRF